MGFCGLPDSLSQRGQVPLDRRVQGVCIDVCIGVKHASLNLSKSSQVFRFFLLYLFFLHHTTTHSSPSQHLLLPTPNILLTRPLKYTASIMPSPAATPSASTSKVFGASPASFVEPSPASTYGSSTASNAGDCPQTPGREVDGMCSQILSSDLF
jgi:hypothetical protein